MTDLHNQARKALAEMALEAKNAAVIATGPENIKAIAALVAYQDAQIAALRDVVNNLASKFTNGDEIAGGFIAYADLSGEEAEALFVAASNTAKAANAYEARIRADERERCLTVIQHYKEDYGPQYQDDKLGELLASHFDRIAESIRNMEGE